MADILFVCVRKDLARADALADVFQAAGFSIGDLPETEAELRAAGAGLLVWSEGASQSPPFNQAAARVLAAGRAVLATLDGCQAPAELGSAPLFDLSGWRGDADDSLLDPLFAAIDKMAAERRAELEQWGASARRRDTSVVLDGRHGAVVHPAETGAFAESDPVPVALVKADRKRLQAAQGWRRGAPRGAQSLTVKRRATPSVGQMLIPLLASAGIAAAAYFGGLAESTNAPDTPHSVRVAIPPAPAANLVRLSAPAIEAEPEIVLEPQATLPSASQATAADDVSVSIAAAEPPRPRLRVRAPSARFRALSPAFGDSFEMAALTAPHLVELEPVTFTRRGRMTRIRAETLDSDARGASAHSFEGVRVERTALVNGD
jgi:hypothetical protein